MKHYLKRHIPLAIAITLIAVIYQRSTGPTYPKKVYIGTEENKIKIRLPRSHGGETNALIEIPKVSKKMNGILNYKRYPTNDVWTSVVLEDRGNILYGELPQQPPAGKLKYKIELLIDGIKQEIGTSEEDAIIIRFKGDVPTAILAPHVFFMFFSMLLGVLAALEASKKTEIFTKVTHLSTASLMIGGMVLGPIVQKYAFGVYWAGFPYDKDLTDNKLLIAVIFWLFASLLNIKARRPWAVIMAACVLMGVYSIPHSMQGSQFNYEKNQLETDID